MKIIEKIKNLIRPGILVETETHHGELVVECVVHKADGTLKSSETARRPINFRTNHGKQVVSVEDIVQGRNTKRLLSSWGILPALVIIVDDGLEYVARYITQSTVGYFSWLALDGGVTVEATTTTALTSEITTLGGARALATVSVQQSGGTGPYCVSVWQYTFSFTGTLAIYGCGVANQLAIGGNFLMVHLFSAVKNVDNTDTMQLTMSVTMSR